MKFGCRKMSEWLVEKMKEDGRKKRKYLAGYLDFGALGRRDAFLFKNDNRKSANHPAFRLFVKESGEWREIGAFWVKESSKGR